VATVFEWVPALNIKGELPSPTGAPGLTGLTAVAGPDGKQLVAARGLPLYRFVKDKDPGDSYGDGVQSFGGVWTVVTTAGKAKTTATTSDGTVALDANKHNSGGHRWALDVPKLGHSPSSRAPGAPRSALAAVWPPSTQQCPENSSQCSD